MFALKTTCQILTIGFIMQIALFSLPQIGFCQSSMDTGSVEITLSIGPFMSLELSKDSMDLGTVDETSVSTDMRIDSCNAYIRTNRNCKMVVQDYVNLYHEKNGEQLSPTVNAGISIASQSPAGVGKPYHDIANKRWTLTFMPGVYNPSTSSYNVVSVTIFKGWDITDTPGLYVGTLTVTLVPD